MVDKFKTQLLNEATKESIKTPILLMHGNKDDIIPIKASQTANQILVGRGHSVHFETYNAPHKIPKRKMGMIREFITDPSNIIKF